MTATTINPIREANNLKVGQKLHNGVTVISIGAKQIQFKCKCGRPIRRMVYQAVPEMCKECSKTTRATNIKLAEKDNSNLHIRDYNKSEQDMIKQFKKDNK